MEEEKRKIYTIVAIVAVVTVLVSCLVAAVAGGAAAFLVARRQSQVAVGQALERRMEEWAPQLPPEVPTPVPPIEREPLLLMQGALIQKVVPDSPADRAGLKAGDIILAVDDIEIGPGYPLSKAINRHEPNDRVTIRFWREGREDTVRVTLGENPDNPGRAYLGVSFQMVVRPRIEMPED